MILVRSRLKQWISCLESPDLNQTIVSQCLTCHCFLFFFPIWFVNVMYIYIDVFWSRYFCKVMADLLTERPCSQLDVFFFFFFWRKLPGEEITLQKPDEDKSSESSLFRGMLLTIIHPKGKEGVTMIFTMFCACFSQLAWEKEVTPKPDWGACIQVPLFVGHFAAIKLPLSWKKR